MYFFKTLTYGCLLSASIACFADQPSPIGRLTVSTIQDKGLGYDKGYSTLGAFLIMPYSEKRVVYPFVDIRAHNFNDGKWAANCGMGLRLADVGKCNALGGNIYYDYRRTNTHLQQVGMGLEALSRFADCRLNGYFPFGNKLTVRECYKWVYPEDYYLNLKVLHRALPGMNVEVETSLKKWNAGVIIDPYLAIGPYFYQQKHAHNIWGGQARVGVNLWRNIVRFEVRGSYDPTFHGILQGLLSISAPLGKLTKNKGGAKCHQNIPLALITPVQRQEIIVNSEKQMVWSCNY
ncbi:MAG: inverse autotransporter beta domain-containing protein [Chlamydiae bacterium]|nr:inverse autotransporter beta domain-containing protein [Chlamydiota bacterium]